MGWLVDTPKIRPEYYAHSCAYLLSDSLVNFLTACLQPVGRFLKKQGKSSLIINNPLGFTGLLIFFYFGFDLSLNNYGLQRTIIEIFLLIVGLIMMFLKTCPAIWQGSFIHRFFNWWGKTN